MIRGERRRSEEITVPKAAKSEQPPKAKRIPIKTTEPRRDRADATRVRKAQIVAEGHRDYEASGGRRWQRRPGPFDPIRSFSGRGT